MLKVLTSNQLQYGMYELFKMQYAMIVINLESFYQGAIEASKYIYYIVRMMSVSDSIRSCIIMFKL